MKDKLEKILQLDKIVKDLKRKQKDLNELLNPFDLENINELPVRNYDEGTKGLRVSITIQRYGGGELESKIYSDIDYIDIDYLELIKLIQMKLNFSIDNYEEKLNELLK